MSSREVRLGRGRFRLAGFGPKVLPSVLGRFDYIGRGEPPVLDLRDVVFFPDLRPLYRADGVRIEESRPTYVESGAPVWPARERKTAQTDYAMPETAPAVQASERIAEPVLFLGKLDDHYGHFLTDGMARMWALDRIGPRGKVLFAPDPGERLAAPHVRFVLDALGLDGSRILRPQGRVRLDRVILPIPALQLSRIYRVVERPHRTIGAKVRRMGLAAPGRPVYLSRSGLGEGYRVLPGEERLEAALAREGFLIVHPERLGLAEQIMIFNQDEPVVGPFGSALHTVLFRARLFGQRIGAIFPDKIMERIMMVDAAKGSRAVYVNGMTESGVPEDRYGHLAGRAWAVDADLVMARLDEAGFFGRRGRRGA